MNIKREDIYSKELDFMVSTSYGPADTTKIMKLKAMIILMLMYGGRKTGT